MLLPVWAKWGGDRVEGRKAITLVGFYRNGSQFLLQLPRWCSGKESTCQCRRCGFDPWVGKIPWRRGRSPTPVFLPGESHGQRSLGGYSPWDYKESDMTEQLHSPTPYKLTARSNQNCIAVCRSTQNQQDIHLCSCFSIVTALNEIEAMHWAPVFQTVFSRDYGKVHLHFKKKGPIQSVSRNN